MEISILFLTLPLCGNINRKLFNVVEMTRLLTDVGDVRAGLADGAVLLDLAGEGAAEVHGAGPRLVGLQPQHARAGQLVVRAATRALLLHLHHVDRVPAALDLFGVPVPGLLN